MPTNPQNIDPPNRQPRNCEHLGDPLLLDDLNYQKLVSRLAEKFPLTTELLQFQSKSFYFTKVLDPGDLPWQFDDAGQLQWQPYWAEDWESSRSICHLLMETPVSGRRLLDLGCGLGLTGAVAASQGAQVLLADHAEPALEFSRLNCWPWLDNCEFRQVDWCKTNPDLGQFDLIVGAEIIYDSDDWIPLSKFWQRHLTKTGEVMLCDPYRKTGREFRGWIEGQGWQTRFEDREIPGHEKPVNVIRLQLPT